jgi:hypothetical protein
VTRRRLNHREDPFPRDAAGRVGHRAWLYSGDSDGNLVETVDPLAIGYTVMPINPTPAHALSQPDDGGREEEQAREGRRYRIISTLTDLERNVLRLQGRLLDKTTDRRRVLVGDVPEWTRGGYTYLPGTEEIDANGAHTVEVFGHVVEQHEPLNHAQIAEELGVTERQVRRAVETANRKIRRAEER